MKQTIRKHASARFNKSEKLQYEYHLPVLLNEAVEWLIHNPDGVYIDGTLGGGGHTEAILSKLSNLGELHSFDKDEFAVDYCTQKFKDELNKGDKSRLIIHNECFSKACSIQSVKGLDGILLDLGLSSRQLDDSRRGFSYRVDTNLDMRFYPQGKTAEELLHAATEEEIIYILRNYGEEPYANRIARRIIEKRRAFPLKSTFDLKNIILECVPPQHHIKSLSRVFQAFRIAINNELEILQFTLTNCLPALNNKARIVVISYHSLEDRIVKNFFKEHKIPKKIVKYTTKDVPMLNILTPKPLTPDKKEISLNPRSRSAKMRVAEVIRT